MLIVDGMEIEDGSISISILKFEGFQWQPSVGFHWNLNHTTWWLGISLLRVMLSIEFKRREK